MTRREYVQELQSLIESFDEHVTPNDAANALSALAEDLADTKGWDPDDSGDQLLWEPFL